MKGYLSVKEAAANLGVTVQTVYNHLKDLDENFIKKENRKTLISNEGIEEIRARLSPDGGKDKEATETDINLYLDYINTLKEQIKAKDDQIEQLLERQRELNYLNYSALDIGSKQQEEQQEEIIIDVPVEEQEHNFFKRLKYLFTGKLD